MSGKKLFAVMLFLSGLMITVWPVQAHTGGVLYLANEPCGDFEVSTWVLPQLVTTVEPIHFDLLVLEASVEGQVSQEFVLGADITVRATPLEGDIVILEDQATNIDSENELFYEAVLNLEEAGEWQIDIVVDNGESSCQTNFVLLVAVVAVDSPVNWYSIGGAVVVIIAAAIFVLLSRPRDEDA